MKKPCLQEIVFNHTLPKPKGNDPTTFFGHVQRNLVPEVRHEVQVFYGSLDCIEAQYPGLDYTHEPHRRRLGRYTWHKRLFRTFDELGLTNHEILSLCQWEGTRSAKERYEAETKRKIRDTTADEIAQAPASEGPRGRYLNGWAEPQKQMTVEVTPVFEDMDVETEAEQSDEDDVISSIGVQLNRQLQAAVEARSRGEEATVDAQWEQWMKEAMERNDLDRNSILSAIREGRSLSSVSSTSIDNLNDSATTRNHPEALMPAAGNTLQRTDSSASQPRFSRHYNDLRSMLSDLQSANNQLAVDNAQLAMLLTRSQPETAR